MARFNIRLNLSMVPPADCHVAPLRETFFLLPSQYGLAAHWGEYFFD
ncbi:MAG: hypothetical protein ACOYMG_27545 [Candidatus Methylumidiphilus sp.]